MMANRSLFRGRFRMTQRADVMNEAGGPAYALSPKQALAQLAATGTFSGTFYATAKSQLDRVRDLADEVRDNLFLAKLAVYARERAFMKDMPAALVLLLARRDTELMHRVFDRVIDNGRMVRTVFQMARSGQFRMNGLSSSLQRALRRWLNEASVGKLLSASIGNDPSLRDVLRMARPKPVDNERRALFGWLAGRDPEHWAPAGLGDLPSQIVALEAYRQAASVGEQLKILQELDVRWDLLADAARGPRVWRAIARKMGPQALRMNLNTLMRHEVFTSGPESECREMIADVARRIADEKLIRRSRQFPYQFLAAYLSADERLPAEIRRALHQAAEIACGNIPLLPGPVLIGVDVSGSMSWSVTGFRERGTTSKVRCVDVAALFAAAILRRNPESVVVPFDTTDYQHRLDPNDSILSLAERLAKYGGGGTDCSVPLKVANTAMADRRFVGCVLVSDNESWVGRRSRRTTEVMNQWKEFVTNQQRLGQANPKLVCIDIQPYTTTQAPDRADILNVGGFSDAVFGVVASFLAGEPSRFVTEVESIEL